MKPPHTLHGWYMLVLEMTSRRNYFFSRATFDIKLHSRVTASSLQAQTEFGTRAFSGLAPWSRPRPFLNRKPAGQRIQTLFRSSWASNPSKVRDRSSMLTWTRSQMRSSLESSKQKFQARHAWLQLRSSPKLPNSCRLL